MVKDFKNGDCYRVDYLIEGEIYYKYLLMNIVYLLLEDDYLSSIICL